MTPKFRAWDSWRKRMSVVDRIYIDTEGVRLYDDFGEYWRDFRDAKLMQSTGLKDKNGKEIFEGDIVQFEDCYEVSDFLYINTGIIEWCQGGFHVTNRDSVLMEDLLDGDSLDVTIFGNIYENKELLDA
ncbi:MAG: YopX family protein [Streptococcus mitis]|jgi:hypothetical protein|nr:YopX family protein [Streptococcus mitis]MDU4516314.1 YopX family protein [Streptococcus mitis]